MAFPESFPSCGCFQESKSLLFLNHGKSKNLSKFTCPLDAIITPMTVPSPNQREIALLPAHFYLQPLSFEAIVFMCIIYNELLLLTP